MYYKNVFNDHTNLAIHLVNPHPSPGQEVLWVIFMFLIYFSFISSLLRYFLDVFLPVLVLRYFRHIVLYYIGVFLILKSKERCLFLLQSFGTMRNICPLPCNSISCLFIFIFIETQASK